MLKLYLDGKFENTYIESKSKDIECFICYELLTQNNVIKINDCNYSVNLNFKCPMYKCNNICTIDNNYIEVENQSKLMIKQLNLIIEYLDINE